MGIKKIKKFGSTLKKLIFILMASLFVIISCFSLKAWAVEEYATSDIYLKTAEEPGPEPVPVPVPDDPGGFIGGIQTGDPLAIILLVLVVFVFGCTIFVACKTILDIKHNKLVIGRGRHVQ